MMYRPKVEMMYVLRQMMYRTAYEIMDKISTTCTLCANFTRVSEFHTRSVFHLRKSANFTGEAHRRLRLIVELYLQQVASYMHYRALYLPSGKLYSPIGELWWILSAGGS